MSEGGGGAEIVTRGGFWRAPEIRGHPGPGGKKKEFWGGGGSPCKGKGRPNAGRGNRGVVRERAVLIGGSRGQREGVLPHRGKGRLV